MTFLGRLVIILETIDRRTCLDSIAHFVYDVRSEFSVHRMSPTTVFVIILGEGEDGFSLRAQKNLFLQSLCEIFNVDGGHTWHTVNLYKNLVFGELIIVQKGFYKSSIRSFHFMAHAICTGEHHRFEAACAKFML